LAAVERDRAQRIGGGETLQRGAAELAAPPQRLGIGVAGAAIFDKAGCILFGKPLDLAKPKAQREAGGWIGVVRPSRRALWALLGMRIVVNGTKRDLILRSIVPHLTPSTG